MDNEISYHSNGNKQLEGTFSTTKPDILTTYREDGTIKQSEYATFLDESSKREKLNTITNKKLRNL